MTREFTTMKMPKNVRRSVDTVRARIVARGVDNAPPELVQALKERDCPLCHTPMEETIEMKYYWECPSCGMTKPVADIKASGTSTDDILKVIGATALVGLGVYLAAKMLK